MRLVWLTDIHLNFLKRSGPFRFGQFIRNNSNSNAVVISGDISESPTLQEDLIEFYRGLCKPIYFVLGNHDYYDGSFEKTNQIAKNLSNINENLVWLTERMLQIGKNTFLIGQEGWYDARCGEIDEYHNKMNDFNFIEDFNNLSFQNLIAKFRELALVEAQQAKRNLDYLIKYEKLCKNIIFVTHFPPFTESSLNKDQKTESEYLPYYVNLTMGIMLIKFAQENPEINITVLCGHTHYSAFYQPLINLKVYTGSSEYKNPKINKIFEIE